MGQAGVWQVRQALSLLPSCLLVSRFIFASVTIPFHIFTTTFLSFAFSILRLLFCVLRLIA